MIEEFAATRQEQAAQERDPSSKWWGHGGEPRKNGLIINEKQDLYEP